MAVVVPYVENPAWVDGSGGGTPITAAKLNVIEEGIYDAHLMPAVRVYHSVNQAVVTATLTALAFNGERFDQAGGVASTQHDTATNNTRLTCRYAGIYQITGCAEFSANATGYRDLRVYVNGATVIALNRDVTASGTLTTEMNVTTLYGLAVNDYVELCVYQTAGVNVNVAASANWSPEFSMVRVA